MKMLSLFSGIGGIDLAARWAGIETVAFCEIEPFCQKVLRKNFGQDAVIFDDVRTLTAESLSRAGIDPESISLVAGGFPCQDVSLSGKGAGLEGERSGLWREFIRIVRILRPRYTVIENVPGLLGRGLDRVLADLSESGFDAQWEVLPAVAFGAPHVRERVFIIAHAHGERCGYAPQRCFPIRLSERVFTQEAWLSELPESAICGVGDGIPRRVDRLRALGNAVVPQQVYPILKAIADYEAA